MREIFAEYNHRFFTRRAQARFADGNKPDRSDKKQYPGDKVNRRSGW
jgi:hypothetical protein